MINSLSQAGVEYLCAGHYHLSSDYADSLAVSNRCVFMHTGVIGNGNRDGRRHSRLIEGGLQLSLMSGTHCDDPHSCVPAMHSHFSWTRGCVSVLSRAPAACLPPRCCVPVAAPDAALPAADSEGFKIRTLDHEEGAVRTDLSCSWDSDPELPAERNYFISPPQVLALGPGSCSPPLCMLTYEM